MKKTIVSTAIIMITIFFFSCDKRNVIPMKSKLLKSFVYYRNGEISTAYYYKYDDSLRLIEIRTFPGNEIEKYSYLENKMYAKYYNSKGEMYKQGISLLNESGCVVSCYLSSFTRLLMTTCLLFRFQR